MWKPTFGKAAEDMKKKKRREERERSKHHEAWFCARFAALIAEAHLAGMTEREIDLLISTARRNNEKSYIPRLV